jgi:release factor glutamine methyltransferase
MTLKEATARLTAAGIDDGRAEARRIFRHFGGFADYELLSPTLECNSEALYKAIERREKREPLQYIIGEVDFYRESYKVTPDCLIPRSDTEILVDYAVKNLPEGAKILDLCTGSGCVGLSVINNLKGATAVLADISEKALEVARENAARLGLSDRVTFISCDATQSQIDGEFDALLSNPPYVSDGAYCELEAEIYFEPRLAFVGGIDGGDLYRAITPLYKKIAEEGFIAYEIGYDQANLITKIAEKSNLSAEIISDLSGNARVAVLRAVKS